MFERFTHKKGKPGLVGITASTDTLAIAHVKQENGKPVLACCDEFPAASDTDREEVLERQVKRLDLENTPTNYVLSPADYKLFLVEAPQVEAHEMEAAVKWKIKDLVDSPVDELAVTLFPVPEDAYRNQSEMVYAVAARKSRIRQVVDMITRAGLELVAIDIPELVLMNISKNFSDDSNGLAFIDLRSTGSTLNLCLDGKIYLTRHLNTRVDQDIINSAEWDQVRERLVLEIQRSLDYFESQMGQKPITRIVVAPRKNDTRMLAGQLNDSMTVSVEGLDLADKFAGGKELSPELQQSCILAIGGAMRDSKVAA